LPDTQQIYQSFANRYHALVTREDHQNHLLPAIRAISPLAGKDVIELGAGTGRVTCLIAPHVHSLVATDQSLHMLSFCQTWLTSLGISNIALSLGSHRALPFQNQIADTVISGWSFCYAAINAGTSWKNSLEQALSEAERVLRPGGILILIESLGTGYETPNRPDVLVDYLNYLDSHGFQSTWIRTDYCFKDTSEAKDLTTFFFGENPLPMWESEKGVIVPECTGLWWKKFQ